MNVNFIKWILIRKFLSGHCKTKWKSKISMRFFLPLKAIFQVFQFFEIWTKNFFLFILHDLIVVVLLPERNPFEWKCCERFKWTLELNLTRKRERCHRKFRNVFQSASHFCSNPFVRIFDELPFSMFSLRHFIQ